ncbi:MAG: carbonic anhydrase, partial [Verrucomicrobia bacterium]|nr:carbonic anhydrase [Verrucomicrobiota bacterium]
LHPNRGQEQRSLVYAQQKPFAVIVGCSDSRAAPEIIFDQGIGDLFVVRVAGNVIGQLELDSIDYSALVLGSSVILVMGHENCGAVAAVIEGKTQDIEAVAKLIEPAVRQTKGKRDQLYWATVENAVRMKNIIQKSPAVQRLIKQGKMAVHAAYYHLESGQVDLIE